MRDPAFQTTWEASINALDLAWEMGTLHMGETYHGDHGSSRGHLPRLEKVRQRVSFAQRIEVYVGFENSMRFKRQLFPVRPLLHQRAYHDFLGGGFMDFVDSFEDEGASDEVSWMSARQQEVHGDLQPFLNRDAAGITEVQDAVHQDDFVEIEVEAAEDASEMSDSSSIDSVRSYRHSTIAYFMDINPIHCRPRWHTYEALHADITSYANKDTHDLTRVHIVGHPPEDLQLADIRPVLVQQPEDITEGSTFQLTLLDVVFHNALPSLEAETVRRVKLLPRTISRKALIAVLGLQPYCKYVRQACLVWHNRRPVKTQAKALIDLRHGDYLQVAVPPGRGELRKQYTRDVAQCFRRGYRASNVPVVMEAHPEGLNVSDMPVIDTFNYIPRAEDLDYDRDAMTLMQVTGISRPEFDPWPPFMDRLPECDAPVTDFKVGNEDRVEAEIYVTSHGEPPAIAGPALRFGNEIGFLQELYPFWEHLAATEIEEEGRVLYVQTWFSDHDRFPTCERSRPARLLSDPWRWLDTMAEAWDDRVDPESLIDFYVIFPRPRVRDWADQEGVPHILLLQHPHAGLRSIHITHVDPVRAEGAMTTFVTPIASPVRKVDFYDVLGISDRSMISSLVDCAIWHGEYELDHGQAYPIRHGLSFIVIQNHLRDIVRRAAESSASSSSQAPALLQTQIQRRQVHLFEALELPPEDPPTVAVRICWNAPAQPHPTFLTLPLTAQNQDAEAELAGWGLQVRAVLCLERDQLVCLAVEPPTSARFDYVLVNIDVEDEADIFVHSADCPLTSSALMSILYKLGFWRAVIIHIEEVHPQIFKIQFKDQKVQTMAAQMRAPRLSEWPAQQICTEKMQPFFQAPAFFESEQLLDVGITSADLQDLFLSHQGVLQRDLEGCDIPEEILKAINACDPNLRLDELDRLLIYADGSSLGSSKHIAPLRAEEEGSGDTWAYVVIGERYDPPGLSFLGWSAQPVLYDMQHNHCLGAQRVGADIAEKEALTWASLWRLSQNWTIPTCFRSDSRVTLGQAEGTTGTACPDDSFVFLRSSFQALEAALGRHGILYSHVPGHSGEVWNELCDWLAKREREKSFYCPRPKLNLDRWRKAIAHLWLALRSHSDLPSFCGYGLHAPAPDFPLAEKVTFDSAVDTWNAETHWTRMEVTLSACTANVQSLHVPPHGHGGKLGFLRRQFIDLGFNFMGIQESKTEEFCSCVDNVYRLSAGHHNHQQGVELWIHLQQPYGYIKGKPQYFDRADFQVVFKDARILLVRVDTPYWNSWLLVAYAPQSGIPLKDRESWWQHLTEVVQVRQPHEPMIMMIDANAAPGDFDGETVFMHGLPSSSSTPLLRRFANENDLFMPCTTQAHQGERATWTDPSGERRYCIDYVMLSSHFTTACTLSRVVPELDLCTGTWDHEATAVEVAWATWVPQGRFPKAEGLGYDPALITQENVKEMLEAYTPMNWNANIEDHVQNFNQHLLGQLRAKCPVPKTKPKKPHVTPEIWHLREQKITLKKRLRALAGRQRDESLGMIFRLWKGGLGVEHDGAVHFQKYHDFLWISNLRIVAEYRHTTLKLRKHLSCARHKVIKETFAAMDANAPASQILHALRPILGPSNLRKLKVNTLPHVRNAQGEPCCLPNEAVEVWLEFFRQMEGGVRMGSQQQRRLWIQNLRELSQSAFRIDADELPRLLDLEAAFRRINPTKATGPDKLHPAFCRSHPPLMARQTFGQLLKLAVHGQEDLAHKGGVLHPIWKCKGPKDRCEAYRSILVSSFVGKSLHRCIRQRQMVLFERFLQTEQLGGRPTVPVTLGVHLSRAFVRARRRQGHSVAMLFIDLTEAFYRILRSLVTGEPADDELIMHVGRRMGLSEDLMKDLYEHLAAPAAIEAAGLPFHMRNTIRALHVDTHFKVRGQGDVCRTALGSRPGDCFADIIFSYLWGRILHKLQGALEVQQFAAYIPIETGLRLGDHETMDEIPKRTFLGPTWMDDTCICLSDLDSQVLEQKIHQATGCLLELCESHGLTPNLGAGKTEALLIFQGRGSRQQKIKYFGPNSDRKLKIVGEGGIKQVRVVQHYTHLGCILHHKMDSRKEARRRVGIAQQTFSQHRRHLLQNSALSISRRVELFKTLVWSRFCYGTESWILAEQGTKTYVHNALMRLFRRLLKARHDDHLTDDDILVATGLNSPTELLRLSRLRYLGTLYRCGDRVPWGLINSDVRWTELLVDDLGWLWQQLRGASTLPDPNVSLVVWADIWVHHHSYWKRLVRRGGEHAILQRRLRHRVERFHQGFALVFQQLHPEFFGNGQLPSRVLHPEEAELQACMKCRSVFKSKGGLGAHLFKVHGIPSRLRMLFETTCCGSCMKEYHTFSKLHAHLRRSERCRGKLWGRRCRFAPTGGSGSIQDKQLCQEHDGILPPLQAEGPHLEDGPTVELPEYDLQLAEAIYLKILEAEGMGDVENIVRSVTDDRVTTWTTWRTTLAYMLDIMTAEDIQALDLGEYDIKRLLHALQRVQAWPFLAEALDRAAEGSRPTLAEIEYDCTAATALAGDRPRFWSVPRPMARERFFIHAFSGRRRAGDLQHFIEEAQAAYPDMVIYTISVDLMVDPDWGDVSKAEVMQRLLAQRSQTEASCRGDGWSSL